MLGTKHHQLHLANQTLSDYNFLCQKSEYSKLDLPQVLHLPQLSKKHLAHLPDLAPSQSIVAHNQASPVMLFATLAVAVGQNNSSNFPIYSPCVTKASHHLRSHCHRQNLACCQICPQVSRWAYFCRLPPGISRIRYRYRQGSSQKYPHSSSRPFWSWQHLFCCPISITRPTKNYWSPE